MTRATWTLVFFSLSIASCDSGGSNEPDPLVCSLSAAQSLASPFSSDPFTVTYRAARTGDGSISSLTYADGSGSTQTVSSPSLPWTMTETIPATGNASISANGQVANGTLEIEFSATNGSATVDGSDSCAQTAS
jgi:hypothetical protein